MTHEHTISECSAGCRCRICDRQAHWRIEITKWGAEPDFDYFCCLCCAAKWLTKKGATK